MDRQKIGGKCNRFMYFCKGRISTTGLTVVRGGRSWEKPVPVMWARRSGYFVIRPNQNQRDLIAGNRITCYRSSWDRPMRARRLAGEARRIETRLRPLRTTHSASKTEAVFL